MFLPHSSASFTGPCLLLGLFSSLCPLPGLWVAPVTWGVRGSQSRPASMAGQQPVPAGPRSGRWLPAQGRAHSPREGLKELPGSLGDCQGVPAAGSSAPGGGCARPKARRRGCKRAECDQNLSNIQTEGGPAGEGTAGPGWEGPAGPQGLSRTLSRLWGQPDHLQLSAWGSSGQRWGGFGHLVLNHLFPLNYSHIQKTGFLKARGWTAKLLLWKIPKSSTAPAFKDFSNVIFNCL